LSRSRLLRGTMSGWGRPAVTGPAFPTAGSTGAVLPGGLVTVGTGHLTSGSGWTWDPVAELVTISGAGTVFDSYNVLGGVFVNADNVTVSNCSIAAGVQVSGANGTFTNCAVTDTEFGFNLNPPSTGTAIRNCTISGLDAGANRVAYGVYSDTSDPSLLVTGCKIFWMEAGIHTPQLGGYTISGCWIGDFGYTGTDHSDGIFIVGTATGLITGNTIINQLDQTDAIFMDNRQGAVGNFTITGNLLGGGDYAFYGGALTGGPYGYATNAVFSGNYFTTQVYPNGGQFGPATAWSPAGNTWSGNTWYDGPGAGQPVAAPGPGG
jgi:hypothetical protein